MGLLRLTVAILCFDENSEQPFEDKRQNPLQAELFHFTKPAEALAHMRQLLQAASTAYGSEFMTAYDLYKLVKTKLSPTIRHEMDDVTAVKKTIDLRRLDWGQIEDLVIDVWGTASRRPRSYYTRLEIDSDEIKDQQPTQDVVPFASHAAETACSDKLQDSQVPTVR